jgi:hypothetical protein
MVMAGYGVPAIPDDAIQPEIEIDSGPSLPIGFNHRPGPGISKGIVGSNRIATDSKPDHNVLPPGIG